MILPYTSLRNGSREIFLHLSTPKRQTYLYLESHLLPFPYFNKRMLVSEASFSLLAPISSSSIRHHDYASKHFSLCCISFVPSHAFNTYHVITYRFPDTLQRTRSTAWNNNKKFLLHQNLPFQLKDVDNKQINSKLINRIMCALLSNSTHYREK